jgi:hypothetical protein
MVSFRGCLIFLGEGIIWDLVEFLAWDLMGSSWDFMWDFHGNLLDPQIIPT